MSMMEPSGPGPYAKRTDRQGIKKLPNAAYGEQKDFQAQQEGAPMAKTAKQQPAVNNLMASVIPFTEPTRRPGEPVTAGANAGPGPGREVLGMKSSVDSQVEDLSKLAKYLPALIQYADSPQSTGTMKAFVKYLRSQSQ